MHWRVIPFQNYDAKMNMAIDQAILESVSAGKCPPTIRLYTWKPHAISLGYGQHRDILKNQNGIDVVRRPTGGNAVYHGIDDLTYAVIAPHELFGGNPINGVNRQAYTTICTWIVAALKHCGLEAELYGSNDVIMHGKKVAGNAQRTDENVLLQHGSIFVSSTADEWDTYLNIPTEKLVGIANLQPLQKEKVALALLRTFTHNPLVQSHSLGELTDAELSRAKELAKTTYAQFEVTGSERPGTICAIDIQRD